MFDIVGEDNFARDEGFGQSGVSVGEFAENILCPFILFGYDAAYFLVDEFGSVVAVGFSEAVVLSGGVVVADVWQA